MANRIVLLASVLIAGAALAVTSASAAPAADECLAKPKNPSPAGKHWYYRTNRATQRKCWYLGDEGANIVAVTPPKQSVSATPVDPGQKVDPGPKIDVQPPAANARAELIDEPRNEQAVPPAQPQPEEWQGAPDGANTRNGVVASRWADSFTAFSSNQATAANDPTPASRVESSSPVLAADPVAPAEQPSVAVDPADHLSLVLLAAAIALVVIVGGAIVMSFVSRWRDRRNFSSRYPAPQDVTYEMPWTRSREATVARPAPVVRGPGHGRLNDEIEEMEQLLASARQARAN